jgi:hypothetical protein
MVTDQIFDPRASIRKIDIWRCLNCGETIDQHVSEVKKGKHPNLEEEKRFQVA